MGNQKCRRAMQIQIKICIQNRNQNMKETLEKLKIEPKNEDKVLQLNTWTTKNKDKKI